MCKTRVQNVVAFQFLSMITLSERSPMRREANAIVAVVNNQRGSLLLAHRYLIDISKSVTSVFSRFTSL